MATINAEAVKKLFLAGAHALNEQKDYINELNVFPVPDGDTGTNMTMTVISSSKEILNVSEESMETVCRAISSGALKGARGNSGVILSQLFRGFMRSIREKKELGVRDLAEAMTTATDSAYRAVMKPKEGTILTVARCMAEKAETLKEEAEIAVFMERVLETGDETLKQTPELLPVLKQAGVVDSGGQGLMVFLHGLFDAYTGKRAFPMTAPVLQTVEGQEEHLVDTAELETADIKFQYCTEFIIKSEKTVSEKTERALRTYLETIGDSIVCVADENVVKIHVHTNDPGLAIQKALTYGQLSKLKIDNMKEEHEERLFKNAEKLAEQQKKATEKAKNAFDPKTAAEMGFVAVCSGEGLTSLFTELGVNAVISGGQTMNPSTEDFISAVRTVNAKNIFLLPNNPNIILAAEQAVKMVRDRSLVVLPTTTVAEGISAMLAFMPSGTVKENAKAMTAAFKRIKSIEVTYSIRDTKLGGVSIKKGDFMALSGKSILGADKDLCECVKTAVKKAVKKDSSVISLYYGADVTEEDASALADHLSEVYGDVEVEVAYGGQPVYYYLLSIE